MMSQIRRTAESSFGNKWSDPSQTLNNGRTVLPRGRNQERSERNKMLVKRKHKEKHMNHNEQEKLVNLGKSGFPGLVQK